VPSHASYLNDKHLPLGYPQGMLLGGVLESF
jgi:hypothetical protein